MKVPAEALETYRSAKNWSKFVKLTAIEESSVKVNVDYDAKLGSVYVNKTLYNGELIFEKGTDLEVTIQPARGKEVSSVLVNGVERIGDLENNTLYLDGVEENLKIEVKFSTPNCMIRLICVDGGAVAFPIASGGNIELSVEPEVGWVIRSVYVNNVDLTSQVQNSRLPLKTSRQTNPLPSSLRRKAHPQPKHRQGKQKFQSRSKQFPSLLTTKASGFTTCQEICCTNLPPPAHTLYPNPAYI